MQRQRHIAVGFGDGLAANDLLAGPNQRHRRLTYVLHEGEDHARRERHPADRAAGGVLVAVRMNPACEGVAMEEGEERH